MPYWEGEKRGGINPDTAGRVCHGVQLKHALWESGEGASFLNLKVRTGGGD